jgi:hypothetical protein
VKMARKALLMATTPRQLPIAWRHTPAAPWLGQDHRKARCFRPGGISWSASWRPKRGEMLLGEHQGRSELGPALTWRVVDRSAASRDAKLSSLVKLAQSRTPAGSELDWPPLPGRLRG